MKKVLVFTALLLICSLAFGQGNKQEGIVFTKGSLSQVLAKAKAENKLVFVDVYASWCGPCKRMAADIFPQKKVGDYFNATFVNAKFDAEQGEGITVARTYKVDRYPTFLILDGDGVLKGTLIGGSPADDFIARIKKLVEKGTTDE